MNPHKFTLHLSLLTERLSSLTLRPSSLARRVFLCLILLSLFAEMSFPKQPTGGRLAIVVDERLSALRREPQLNGRLVKRLSRGRMVAVRASRRTSAGVVFFLVNVSSRTHGWIQREAVVAAGRT